MSNCGKKGDESVKGSRTGHLVVQTSNHLIQLHQIRSLCTGQWLNTKAIPSARLPRSLPSSTLYPDVILFSNQFCAKWMSLPGLDLEMKLIQFTSLKVQGKYQIIVDERHGGGFCLNFSVEPNYFKKIILKQNFTRLTLKLI